MTTSTQKRMIRHINQTVFELLYHYHFDEITVQKICESAEINRSTFYRYFQDKYDLLYSLPQYMTEQFIGDTNDAELINSSESFKAFIYYIEKHKKVFKHLLVSSRQSDVFRSLTNASREMILYGAKNNNSDPLAQKIRKSKYPDILADFYSSGMIEVLRRWVENDYNYSPNEIFITLNHTLENCND